MKNINASHPRFHWVDIAKCLLIIMVVVHHLPYVAHDYIGTDKIDVLNDVNCLFVSYFMAAFFIITGFCTNFERDFKSFLVRNLKTIVLPGALFTILLAWFFNLLARDFTLSHWLDSEKLKYILLNGSEWWFLSALFIDKMVYWLLHRYVKNGLAIGVITLSMMTVGIYLYSRELPEYWFYQHALAFIPFLAFGHWLRGHKSLLENNALAFGGGGIVLLLSVLTTTGVGIPYIHLTYDMIKSVWLIPMALIYAILGSLLVFRLSQCIGKNKILEYIGGQTLVVYMFHADIENILLGKVLIFSSTLLNVIAALAVGCVTLVVTVGIAWIINHRYLKWMVGKF